MEKNPDKIHFKFAGQIGSEHIATIVNVRQIVDICKEYKPRRILELGGGIGTLSYAMLANSDAVLDIYEDDEFCQRSLRDNLFEFQGKYNILTSYKILPIESSYDLMVIDGGQKEFFHPEYIYANYLENIKIIYIEGIRNGQCAWLSKGLRKKYVCKMKKIAGENISGHYNKGGKLIFCSPSRSILLRNISYLYIRLREDALFDRVFKFILRIFK